MFVDPIFKLSIPIPALPSLKFPPLAAAPRRRCARRVRDTANEAPATAATALLAAARSTPNAVTGDGEVDTAVYGTCCVPAGWSGVRGAGSPSTGSTW